MLSKTFFYAFDTQSKPGSLLCVGIRFEVLELPVGDGTLDQVQLPLLGSEIDPAWKIKALKCAVKSNFPDGR